MLTYMHVESYIRVEYPGSSVPACITMHEHDSELNKKGSIEYAEPPKTIEKANQPFILLKCHLYKKKIIQK